MTETINNEPADTGAGEAPIADTGDKTPTETKKEPAASAPKIPENVEANLAFLPDAERKQAIEKGFKDGASIYKSYVNLESKLGADKIVMPNDKSSVEEWDEFRKSLGVPQGEESYADFPKDFELPEALANNEAYKERIKGDLAELEQSFKKNGLPAYAAKAQAEDLIALEIKRTTEALEKQASEEHARLVELERSWGSNLERNYHMAEHAKNEFFPHLEGVDLKKNVDLLKGLVAVGSQFSEAGYKTGSSSSTYAGTPEEAGKAYFEFIATHADVLGNPKADGHLEKIKERDELYAVYQRFQKR